MTAPLRPPRPTAKPAVRTYPNDPDGDGGWLYANWDSGTLRWRHTFVLAEALAVAGAVVAELRTHDDPGVSL